MISFLTEHESIPNYTLKWEGNRIFLVNNFTGRLGKFVDGKTQQSFTEKEAKTIREKYERLY